jgi:hypothetical protein
MTHPEHESDSSRNNRLTLRLLEQYWPIVVFIFTLGAVYTMLNTAQANSAQRITALEANEQQAAVFQSTVTSQLSQLQTDVSWIKAAVSKPK